MQQLSEDGRAPRLIALENVLGLLTANGGADFTALVSRPSPNLATGSAR